MLTTSLRLHQNAAPALTDLLPAVLTDCGGLLLGSGLLSVSLSSAWPSAVSLGGSMLGLFCCCLSVWFLVRVLQQVNMVRTLDKDGLIARGTITGLWQEEHSCIRKRDVCYVLYAFELPGQRQFAANQRVSLSLFQQLHPGTPVRIRFLPQQPNMSRMEQTLWQ